MTPGRIVNSEMEALILENNLVKEFMPKFNVLLRDDKNFLYLRVTKEDFPRLEITRRIIRDGSFYVGPKTSAKKFRKTINFCQKVFQIRTCRVGIKQNSAKKIEIAQNPERKKLPCMDYHIKKFIILTELTRSNYFQALHLIQITGLALSFTMNSITCPTLTNTMLLYLFRDLFALTRTLALNLD